MKRNNTDITEKTEKLTVAQKKALKSKKVKLFTEAAKLWYSHFSMGEVIKVTLSDGETVIPLIIYDRREFYKGRGEKYEARHGLLNLLVDMSGARIRYSVEETSKYGKKFFTWDCVTKRKEDLKNGILTEYNVGFLISDIREEVWRAKQSMGVTHEVYRKISESNYWENTKVTYHSIIRECNGTTESEVVDFWKEMVANSGMRYHQSPCRGSISAYLYNPDTKDVYRFSDHWGTGIASCNWFLDTNDYQDVLAVAKANISEFQDRFPRSEIIYTADEANKLILLINNQIQRLEELKIKYKVDGVIVIKKIDCAINELSADRTYVIKKRETINNQRIE